jgi:hypothetical protein
MHGLLCALPGFDERAVRWMVIVVSKDRYIISSHNDSKFLNFREDIGRPGDYFW